MYEREPKFGPKIEWTGYDEPDVAKQAVEDVVGEVDQWPRQVSDEDAEAIRERYAELVDADDEGGDGS